MDKPTRPHHWLPIAAAGGLLLGALSGATAQDRPNALAEVRRLDAAITRLTARVEQLERKMPAAPSAAPAPAAPAGAGWPLDTPENETRYVEGRARDLLAASVRGLPSGSISEEQMEEWRTERRQQARLEWAQILRVNRIADELANQRGEPDVYRGAADKVSAVVRDFADTPLSDDTIRAHIETVADQIRTERRARR